jgi:hypothetical protein
MVSSCFCNELDVIFIIIYVFLSMGDMISTKFYSLSVLGASVRQFLYLFIDGPNFHPILL